MGNDLETVGSQCKACVCMRDGLSDELRAHFSLLREKCCIRLNDMCITRRIYQQNVFTDSDVGFPEYVCTGES